MKLLVSVRSAAEARVALEAGVDLLDIKEPRRGSLGAADPRVNRAIAELTAGRVPVSAALGELAHFETDRQPANLSWAGGMAYAKIGLARMAARGDWPAQLRRFGNALPPAVSPVAVAYADHSDAGSPPLDEVIEQAIELGWKAFLLDTFDKRTGGLLDHLPLGRIGQIVQRTRSAGLLTVIAGSLELHTIESLLVLSPAPDYIGVRGAVCRGPRESTIDATKITRLKALLTQARR